MNTQPPFSVPCPQCRKLTLFSPENPFRPFCSERCKIIDLGKWASEDFRIPAEKIPQAEDFQGPDRDESDDEFSDH